MIKVYDIVRNTVVTCWGHCKNPSHAKVWLVILWLNKGPFTRSVFKAPIFVGSPRLVPKIVSCEHIKNDLPTHGSVILKNGWK